MALAVSIWAVTRIGSGPGKPMKLRVLGPLLPLALVAFGAFGCNDTSQPQTAQTAAVPCRCTEPVAAAPAPQVPTRTAFLRLHRHRDARHWAHAESSEFQAETWSESEHSSSTVEYGYEGEVERGERIYADARGTDYDFWVDGYGRRHLVCRCHRHGGWERANGDDAARLDPWHGYDDNDGPENGY